MRVVDLADGVRRADPRILARALSVIERGGEPARDLLAALRTDGGAPHVIGITGPPGAGKSSLVEALGLLLNRSKGPVAVLAVDPSSPFSGGAILGDRVRMVRLAAAPGCFVRSMATRGALGGLAAAAADAVDVFAAAGFPVVLVETVGVGQDEVDVMHVADTVILTLPPGLGDDVQAAKAGIMEIAHLFAVSKADLPGADQAVAHLRAMVELAPPGPWRPPIVQVSVVAGEGLEELAEAVAEHARFLETEERRRGGRLDRAEHRIRRAVQDLAWRRLSAEHAGRLEAAIKAVGQGRKDPYTAAEELLRQLES
ncbi:MAG: methylmalonyl Co-A mutase-associated GTPase MeaB [Acidobacteria bacterium]|nr:methylmalonyl Co-A mutase-associated GTPase MeaB [Acidobacteriota bacterium]